MTSAVISLQFMKLIHKNCYMTLNSRTYHSHTLEPFCTLFGSLLSRASWISTKQAYFCLYPVLVNHVSLTVNQIILNNTCSIPYPYSHKLKKNNGVNVPCSTSKMFNPCSNSYCMLFSFLVHSLHDNVAMACLDNGKHWGQNP